MQLISKEQIKSHFIKLGIEEQDILFGMEVYQNKELDIWSIQKSNDDYDIVIKCSNPNREEDEKIEEYFAFKAYNWRYGNLNFTHYEWRAEQQLIKFNEEDKLKKIYFATKNN